MLRIIFTGLVLVHGFLHLLGFAKAWSGERWPQITNGVSKVAGVAWLLTTLLFLAALALYHLKNKGWPLWMLIAAVVSQVMLMTVWKDAKFGTIANILILLVALGGWSEMVFEGQFKKAVQEQLQQQSGPADDTITAADIAPLPQPVQQYLRYAGVIGQPKVYNFRIVFKGEMRSKKQDWFPFTSVQYNFMQQPSRLFFMEGRMFGMNVPGYHDYVQGKARMNIKLFGLIPVVSKEGVEMNRAETVTLFNDMCLLAPATLIDQRISWTQTGDLSATAVFTNGANKISATLFFNATGQLVNFVSDDRYDVGEGKQLRFSTPLGNYQLKNGRMVGSYGEAIWHYPEGKFVYGKFYLQRIDYNVKEWMD